MRQLKITQSTTSRDDKSMQDYLADINKIPTISVEDEVELARTIQKGGREAEKAKEKLINANLRFVVSVAKQYQSSGLPLADLVSEGNIGLIKAAQKFDDQRGFKFISYAVWWIRQSILQSICDNSRSIRLPLNNVSLLNKYRKMHDEFVQEFQRAPTIEEFADACGIDYEKAASVLHAANRISSIDAPVSDDSDSAVSDMLAGESVTDDSLDKESLASDIMDVMKSVLRPRELEVICCMFGINRNIMNIDELSDMLNMSRERIRQIREKSILKLRDSNGCSLLRTYLG